MCDPNDTPLNAAGCFADLEADLLDFIDSQNLEHLDDLMRLELALRIYRETRHVRRDAQCEEGVHHGCYCVVDQPCNPVSAVPAPSSE